MTPRRPGATWIAAAALVLLLFAAFWPVARGGRSFFHMDLFYEHLPVWESTQRALAAGDSPFWIDGEWCGHPPLFHQEAPIFYPLTVPLLATDAPVMRLADLFALFHFWLAGFAAFLFLRDTTGDARAALFGGVAWMLSTRMVQSALWPNAVGAGAYLPLILWGIVRIGRGHARSGVLLAAISGGLALLLARPHVLLAAAPLLAAVAAWAIAAAPRRGRAAGQLALAAGLALLLGAPSLAPSIALYPETARAEGLTREEREVGPLSATGSAARVVMPLEAPPRWPENAAYPGVLAGVLFLGGLVLCVRRRDSFPRGLYLALTIGGLLGVLFAVGERGPYGLFAELPLLRGFRVPARFLTSWGLAVALGSALALAELTRSGTGRRRMLAGLAILLLAADLALHTRRSAPTAPSALWDVTPELAEGLREVLGVDEAGFPRRYSSRAETLIPLQYRGDDMLTAVRLFDPLKGGYGMRFGLESVAGAGPTLRRTEDLVFSPSPRALELAGAGVLVTSDPRPAEAAPTDPPPIRVAPFPGLPRAILVPEARIVPPEAAVAAVLSPEFDPRRAALFESGDPMTADPAWDAGAARVRGVVYRPGRIELEAQLPAPGVLVVFNSFESGWRARVDGVAAEVERADAAFQGIRLPAGPHRVTLEYRAPGVTEGLLLGLAGVLGTILAAIRFRTRLPRSV